MLHSFERQIWKWTQASFNTRAPDSTFNMFLVDPSFPLQIPLTVAGSVGREKVCHKVGFSRLQSTYVRCLTLTLEEKHSPLGYRGSIAYTEVILRGWEASPQGRGLYRDSSLSSHPHPLTACHSDLNTTCFHVCTQANSLGGDVPVFQSTWTLPGLQDQSAPAFYPQLLPTPTVLTTRVFLWPPMISSYLLWQSPYCFINAYLVSSTRPQAPVGRAEHIELITHTHTHGS